MQALAHVPRSLPMAALLPACGSGRCVLARSAARADAYVGRGAAVGDIFEKLVDT